MFTQELARQLLTQWARGGSRWCRRRVVTSAGLPPTSQRLEDRRLLSATSASDLLEQANDGSDGQSGRPVTIHFSAEDGRLTVSAIISAHIEVLQWEGRLQVLVDGETVEHDNVSADEVRSIAIIGSGGHDLLDLRAVTPLSFPNVDEVNVVGGPGMDTIYGSEFGDGIDAGFEHDLVFAGDGNDTIDGGPGNDHLVGDGGDDLIIGGSGNDLLNGRNGHDTLLGGHGNDRLFGGRGRDLLDGEQDNDVLNGQGGRDTLYVQYGDELKGMTSRDTLHMDDTQPTLDLEGVAVTSDSPTDAFLGHLVNDDHLTHSHECDCDEPFEFTEEWVDLV